MIQQWSGKTTPNIYNNQYAKCNMFKYPSLGQQMKRMEMELMIFISTHRPQMLETEEEICKSETKNKINYITIVVISTHILQVSPNSFKFCKTFTAVSHSAAGR